ncbi:sugar phosphate isomerase/epimerase family protein [Saccharopolyspora sp. TS4A08]|uniref:Sugar phosphate isomerase/epimerase family protein n=1 Tax=Saccharopolyspora ipomoeae TaxID=3042027 RepID=A0ABT6PT52_9PSEU|nr:sugar phosphate isomerase/epimerase family protein [Saccharopolyspora sp. TS4A08]MDI2031187.1 sugar phosphate isomerase/epimerase family protein [Saccharopolyspora sp. TS4A08]
MTGQPTRPERQDAPDRIPVGLSSASVWPQPARAAFEMSADLGFDGVEVMVWADAVSQDVKALSRLSQQHGVPVLAVHAPCLLITQRVWSPEPEERLRKAVVAASELGASTVVVHPPFRWQRRYAEAFPELVEELEETSGIKIAVENMFPLRPPNSLNRLRTARSSGAKGNGGLSAFKPSPDPTDVGFRNYTLDLSHAAAAHVDAIELLKRMSSGLAHVHLADGTGAAHDEHLLPGQGSQPCAEVCEALAADGYEGSVVLEVNTRKAKNPQQRADLLAEALLFARLHLEPLGT